MISVEDRERSLARSERELSELIRANFGRFRESTKFLKLEFKEEVYCIDEANEAFRSFVYRVNNNLFKRKPSKRLRYVKIIDINELGGISFHVITFNLPYTDKVSLLGLWKQGEVMITSMQNKSKASRYLTQNLGMWNVTPDPRLVGRCVYTSSRGLIRPEELKDEQLTFEDFTA